MSHLRLTPAAAAVALSAGVFAAIAFSATGASAQIYPLTNGPDGRGTNTLDSARGFTGSNAVATERELLYHPERGGNAAAQLGISAAPAAGPEAGLAAGPAAEAAGPLGRHAPHRRRRAAQR